MVLQENVIGKTTDDVLRGEIYFEKVQQESGNRVVDALRVFFSSRFSFLKHILKLSDSPHL